jgi:hypothetical protein
MLKHYEKEIFLRNLLVFILVSLHLALQALIGRNTRTISCSNIWSLIPQFLLQNSKNLCDFLSDKNVWHRVPKSLEISWAKDSFVLIWWLLEDSCIGLRMWLILRETKHVITNNRWCNQSCLYDEVFLKTQKDSIQMSFQVD